MSETSLAARGRLLLSGAGRASLRGGGPAHELLRRSLGRRLDPAEREWIERIERRRRELGASEEEVAFEEPTGTRTRSAAELCSSSGQPASLAGLQFRVLRDSRPARASSSAPASASPPPTSERLYG